MVVPKMLKFVGVVVVLWFIVLCYLGPTMFQLMEDSRKASNELTRINKAIEHLQTQNAKLRREVCCRTLPARISTVVLYSINTRSLPGVPIVGFRLFFENQGLVKCLQGEKVVRRSLKSSLVFSRFIIISS